MPLAPALFFLKAWSPGVACLKHLYKKVSPHPPFQATPPLSPTTLAAKLEEAGTGPTSVKLDDKGSQPCPPEITSIKFPCALTGMNPATNYDSATLPSNRSLSLQILGYLPIRWALCLNVIAHQELGSTGNERQFYGQIALRK